ncbi:MAG TPA: hypothetical protein VE131_02790, partial [Terriglobales bacterium]|nr:hypothetical protein [Terriglobales bacterium]
FTRSTSIGDIKQSDIGLPLNVTYRNYSYASEMEADLKGLRYWRNLHWDCRIWVRILESFVKHHYDGDRFHPTENRLQQARGVCPAARRAPLDGPAAQTNK